MESYAERVLYCHAKRQGPPSGAPVMRNEELMEALIKSRLCNESNRASLWSGGYTRGRCPLVQIFPYLFTSGPWVNRIAARVLFSKLQLRVEMRRWVPEVNFAIETRGGSARRCGADGSPAPSVTPYPVSDPASGMISPPVSAVIGEPIVAQGEATSPGGDAS